MPVEVPGATVNRLCGIGHERRHQRCACRRGRRRIGLRGRWRRVDDPGAVRDGQADPPPSRAASRRCTTRRSAGASPTRAWPMPTTRYSMGETAENVVERCGVSREEQDAFALESHRRWARRPRGGPLRGRGRADHGPRGRKGEEARSSRDEHPRPDTTPEQLAALKPAFKRDASGSVTAGNSSGINDGAAAVLVTSRGACRRARPATDHAHARPRRWPASTRRRWAWDRSPPRAWRWSAPAWAWTSSTWSS